MSDNDVPNQQANLVQKSTKRKRKRSKKHATTIDGNVGKISEPFNLISESSHQDVRLNGPLDDDASINISLVDDARFSDKMTSATDSHHQPKKRKRKRKSIEGQSSEQNNLVSSNINPQYSKVISSDELQVFC